MRFVTAGQEESLHLQTKHTSNKRSLSCTSCLSTQQMKSDQYILGVQQYTMKVLYKCLIHSFIQMQNFPLSEDFGTLSNSPILFLLSPGKMHLTLFLFQKWLGSPFPEDVRVW